jgi:type IV pilus assembly protein PilO
LNEKRRDFYAEIPVSMRVQGQFHNTVLFFDRVARLSRVVNLKDISMKPAKGGKLTTSLKAVTYKFVEPKKKKKKKSKSKRKRK